MRDDVTASVSDCLSAASSLKAWLFFSTPSPNPFVDGYMGSLVAQRICLSLRETQVQSGRSLGEGSDYPLQHFHLENPLEILAGYRPWDRKRVGRDLAAGQQQLSFIL